MEATGPAMVKKGVCVISIRDRVLFALGTGLGTGLLSPRFATIGALLGIPLTLLLKEFSSPAAYIAIIAVLCLLGIWICQRSAELLNSHDPREVVYDEIVTIPLVFLFTDDLNWRVIIVGFLLHRVLDGTKPPGINQLQRLPGGLGIMMDDVAAGLAGCGCLQVLITFGWL